MIKKLTADAIALLKQLIETPSFSSEEEQTALLIEQWFNTHNIPFKRQNNNVWATNKYFNKNKQTLLLNSHHDTVKPNNGYTKDPFKAIVEDGVNVTGFFTWSLMDNFEWTRGFRLEDVMMSLACH